jgi:hypothetical protein
MREAISQAIALGAGEAACRDRSPHISSIAL